MIAKLKAKFLILTGVALLLLLTFIILTMNILNYTAVIGEADEILSLLSDNKGSFPQTGGGGGADFGKLPPNMSPELPFESRYFSVLISDDGSVLHTDTGKIYAVDADRAVIYAEYALSVGRESGFADQYRFRCLREGSNIRITFLDCGRRLDAFYSFLSISICIASIGFAVVFFILFFFSGRIIRPIVESYEKQKRFITDAGHEMKTPLTIIKANLDLLEMEQGTRECTDDIKTQVQRLSELVGELVYLARMEETSDIKMIDFPVSDIVGDIASSFRASAELQGKRLVYRVAPMISIYGSATHIERLVAILLDNSVKYSSADSEIVLEMLRQGKSLLLTVTNSVTDPISSESLNHLFDRFYRVESSRNSDCGGYGIGLSMAKAIVEAHNGKIWASTYDTGLFRISVQLPGCSEMQ